MNDYKRTLKAGKTMFRRGSVKIPAIREWGLFDDWRDFKACFLAFDEIAERYWGD